MTVFFLNDICCALLGRCWI